MYVILHCIFLSGYYIVFLNIIYKLFIRYKTHVKIRISWKIVKLHIVRNNDESGEAKQEESTKKVAPTKQIMPGQH